VAKTTDTPSDIQKQALKPSCIITQDMLAGLLERNPSPTQYTAGELAPAILLGCRIEPGAIKPSLETDRQGYQRLNLSKG